MTKHLNKDGQPKRIYMSPKEAIRACINISRKTGKPHNFYPCREGGMGKHWHLTTRVKRRG